MFIRCIPAFVRSLSLVARRYTAVERAVLSSRSTAVGGFSRAPLRRRKARRRFAVSFAALIIWLNAPIHCFDSEKLRRLVPRAVREFRRNFLVKWNRLLNEASLETKYLLKGDELNIYVISLKRLSQRAHETSLSLQAQGIPWTVHEAFDGLGEIDAELVSKYAGAKKRKRMSSTFHLEQDILVHLKDKYVRSELIPNRLRESLHERLRFGCFMSHVSIWQELQRQRLPFAVVLEDDALVVANFSNEVKLRLQRLPKDWDLLYLGGCYQRFGERYDVGLLQSRGGLCTYGYVITAKGARHLLQRAVLHSEKPIDHVLDDETLRGRVIAFHAEPPLVFVERTKRSTLAYESHSAKFSRCATFLHVQLYVPLILFCAYVAARVVNLG